MADRFDALLEFLSRAFARLGAATARAAHALLAAGRRRRPALVAGALLVLVAWVLDLIRRSPPCAAARCWCAPTLFDGSVNAYTAGTVLVLPGIHQVRRYSTRDQVYRPIESASATGPAPFQSIEGLSIGVDLTVRWAIDRARLAHDVQGVSRRPQCGSRRARRCRASSTRCSPATPCERSSRSERARDPAGDRRPSSSRSSPPSGSCCAVSTWARSICRPTIAPAWRSSSPRSSRPRRFATPWSSRRRRSSRPQLEAEADKVRRQNGGRGRGRRSRSSPRARRRRP